MAATGEPRWDLEDERRLHAEYRRRQGGHRRAQGCGKQQSGVAAPDQPVDDPRSDRSSPTIRHRRRAQRP